VALTLYFHPLSSFCHKVLIALYENETPFVAHTVDFGDAAARAEFVELWPTAKIPLLRDEAGDRVVPETTVIIEYLDRHYPGVRPLLPKGDDARLEARLWDRLFDLYVMLPMQNVIAERLRPEADRDARAIAAAVATLRTSYDMIERRMAGRTWAAGESFSLADCAAAPALFYAGIVAPFPETHAHLAAYFERLVQRPTVKRTLAEARPFFQLFPMKDSIPRRFLQDDVAGG
jgi:glutathione S-transferase